jgi:hypothetical protein
VVTRSLKRGAVWRIDFKKKEDFRQKIWAVSPFGDFSPKTNDVRSNHQPHIVTVTLPNHQINFILQTAQNFKFLKSSQCIKFLTFLPKLLPLKNSLIFRVVG